VDLANSPLHCGVCGNDCRLGGCNDGRCSPAPTLLATYPPRKPGTHGVRIALDETNLYFSDADAGRVVSVGKQGAGAEELATGLDSPLSIAVDAEFVYFADGGAATVSRVPKRGGDVTTIATDQVNPMNLSVWKGDVYWVANGHVVRAEAGKGPPVVIARPIAVGGDLAVNDVNVLWNVRDLGPSWDGIYAADRFGGGEVGRLRVTLSVAKLAHMGSEMYATTVELPTFNGNVVRIFPDPLVLARDLPSPNEIAFDERHVFFTVESHSAIIQKVEKGGGRATTIASGHWSGMNEWTAAFDLALDETRVFFATFAAIYSVPK
jgi:hypothetical protein